MQVITWGIGLHFMFVHGWGGNAMMDPGNGNEMMRWYGVLVCITIFCFRLLTGTVLLL
jgi:hypothetical protein